MAVFIFTFMFFVLMVLAMCVGIMMGRKPISGSCGGMSALGIDTECDICGGNPDLCDNEEDDTEQKPSKNLSYDAADK